MSSTTSENPEVTLSAPSQSTTILEETPAEIIHLSDEERDTKANDLKEQGNACFLKENYEEAIRYYSEAISVAPEV